ncbi:type II toxin-antitoxin system PemK/MazF family toxin [Leuconostoc mesenteroides]|uniref:type II toxin-antitoxin system PemK/MazF family toxin n=1 Tax=Leuconostoc mesenteroides TaxID=1245 RepID=UPI0021A415EE|nr:type II toxin-antitoxin system PemK/MazF family toxin [Leuconostoc mesenteroides]GLX33918.1 hypothetical protein Lmede01_18960 [Leuconostoc mesenteroides subsp. dextranicum]
MRDEQVPEMKIYTVNIPYEDIPGSKYRPALVIGMRNGYINVLKITKEHDEKSKAIQDIYYKIEEWQEAGLKVQSYVDCHRTYNVSQDYILRNQPKGELTSKDKTKLFAFVHKLLKAGKIK